jgi:hypothetical protein
VERRSSTSQHLSYSLMKQYTNLIRSFAMFIINDLKNDHTTNVFLTPIRLLSNPNQTDYAQVDYRAEDNVAIFQIYKATRIGLM